MEINILSDKIEWFGRYSGYECLTDYFPVQIESIINKPVKNFYTKLLGKIYQVNNKWHFKNTSTVYAEVQFSSKLRRGVKSHILYLEKHLHLLDKIQREQKYVVGTIHFPFSRWSENRLKKLSKIENIILLYNEDSSHFQKYMSTGQIHVIRHGVDIDFFKPGSFGRIEKKKILIVGHFLRNFEMFSAVYEVICKDISNDFEFHFIIPSAYRGSPVLISLAENRNIFFHENLSDEELCTHYQTSNVLLMPMNQSGANTSIVQALATGLPIITTDVGGIRTYGGGDIFTVIENNDIVSMVELFYKLYSDVEYRNCVSSKQREFAVDFLDWNKIVLQHIQLYESVLL